jgi:hypothetical protein
MKKLLPMAISQILSARLTKIALLPLAFALGLAFWTATAASQEPESSSAGGGHQPCTVCHTAKKNPHEITIDCNALEQHLRNHPAYRGPMPQNVTNAYPYGYAEGTREVHRLP